MCEILQMLQNLWLNSGGKRVSYIVLHIERVTVKSIYLKNILNVWSVWAKSGSICTMGDICFIILTSPPLFK